MLTSAQRTASNSAQQQQQQQQQATRVNGWYGAASAANDELPEWAISFSVLRESLITRLGEGSFATVWKGKYYNSDVAIKVWKNGGDQPTPAGGWGYVAMCSLDSKPHVMHLDELPVVTTDWLALLALPC
jgi:hypothetical protein